MIPAHSFPSQTLVLAHQVNKYELFVYCLPRHAGGFSLILNMQLLGPKPAAQTFIKYITDEAVAKLAATHLMNDALQSLGLPVLPTVVNFDFEREPIIIPYTAVRGNVA